MTVTICIIAATCVVSFMAFNNVKLTDAFIFHPPAVTYQNQWYRFFTCGFLHADLPHLAFNMFSLYMFGDMVETAFSDIFGSLGWLLYLILYVAALFVSLMPTYQANKTNNYYNSLGASGAVSAIVFAGILFYPTVKIGLFILPPIIPGFVFGPIYLAITVYLSKQGNDNINHSAHFWGALFGVAYTIVMCYALSSFQPVAHFIDTILGK